MSKEDHDRLTALGLEVETVGDILGTGHAKADPVQPPRHADQPAFPKPGIYFGMPEEDYHAIHAASTSGLKRLSTSSMDYWANSTLNLDKEEFDERKHLSLGKAYHKRIAEGEEAFLASYAVELDPRDYVDEEGRSLLLTTVDHVKAAIAKLGQKPCTTGFDDVTRKAKKEDWIAQLLALDENALVWDAMVAKHEAANPGKVFISAKQHHRVEIAAKMIEAHPELKDAFTGGFAEVSIFWFCPDTGCPMKARLDYLKMRLIVDLKSFANQQGLPINRAIERAIANYRYNLQHVIYDDAVAAARAVVREHGLSALVDCDDPTTEQAQARQDWAFKWAKQTAAPGFLFVFQQTGNAPVTRGRLMPRGTVYSVSRSAAERLKRRWVECANTFGVDPWLDIEPIDTIEDEAIPLYATEL